MPRAPSFFNPSAANSPVMQAYAADPRQALAQSLIAAGSNARPVNSPIEGLARLASALVGAYQSRQLGQEYKERKQQYGDTLEQGLRAAGPWNAPDNVMSAPPDTLQQGLGPMPERPAYDASVIVPKGRDAPGTGGGLSALARVLAGNPDTAPMAADLRISDFERKQGIQDTQDAAKFAQDLEIGGIPRRDAAALPGARAKATMEGEVGLANALAQETQLAPLKQTNAINLERGLGPVKATNAGLVAGAEQPYRMAQIGATAAASLANKDRGPPGDYAGTSIEAQDSNVLLNGDPASRVYAMAYARQSAPKISFDPTTKNQITVTPDMSSVRPPTGGPQGAGPAAAPSAAVPGQTAAGTAAPPPISRQGGVSVTSLGDPQKLGDARVKTKTLLSALDTFEKEVNDSTRGGRAATFAGNSSKLQTAWTNAALLAKGEELYNLGVLSGPDLTIIRGAISDPSTFKGFALTGPKGYREQIGMVRSLIQTKLDEMEKSYGRPTSQGPSVGGANPYATMSDDDILKDLKAKGLVP